MTTQVPALDWSLDDASEKADDPKRFRMDRDIR